MDTPLLAWTLLACGLVPPEPAEAVTKRPAPVAPAAVSATVALPEPPRVDGFDFPVGPPDAAGYYDAQPFGRNRHLGEDWNARTGGHTDLGDPVHSVAGGVVTFAEDVRGGWGNVVRIHHRTEDDGDVESLYAHLERIDVDIGQVVERGELVGTIGDAHGVYVPHLHLELRSAVGLPLGPGYSDDTTGYLAPTPFIRQHRP